MVIIDLIVNIKYLITIKLKPIISSVSISFVILKLMFLINYN